MSDLSGGVDGDVMDDPTSRYVGVCAYLGYYADILYSPRSSGSLSFGVHATDWAVNSPEENVFLVISLATFEAYRAPTIRKLLY